MKTLIISDLMDFSTFFTILIVIIVVFLILREVMCWYWKLNKIVELQKPQTRILFKMYEQGGASLNWDEINKILD